MRMPKKLLTKKEKLQGFPLTEFNLHISSRHFPVPQQQFDTVSAIVTLSDKRKNSVTFRMTELT